MTKFLVHSGWLIAAIVMFTSSDTASAQSAGTPTYRPFPKAASTTGTTGTSGTGTPGTGTPTGMGTGTQPGSGGGTGVGGFGGFAVLTPAQELAVLMDTLTTVELILDSGLFQPSSEIEILFLLVLVYESKYADAVQAAIGGGSSTGGGTTTLSGLGLGTGMGTGTTPSP